MPQITLKQLAELSGLSVRTVSRVLKNQANVVPEKREMVLKLAEEYHYVPNMAARNLRLRKKSFVGILCRDFGTEVFVQKINDLELRLSAAGYYPVLGHLDRSPADLERMLNDWAGIAGYVVVMNSVPENALHYLNHLAGKRLPLRFIFVDQPGERNAHTLLIDRASGVCDAVSSLVEQGRRRILHCGCLDSRKEGIRQAFDRLPKGAAGNIESLHIESHGEFENGYSEGARIMASGADAVLFDTDRMAAGFLKYAAEERIDVPDRIAVVGFDDDIVARMSVPSLSTVAHPVSEINSTILEIIERNPEEIVRRIFPTRFVPRDSSR